ncbi:hypothetical protein [Streptomyces sp. NPDC003688]
MAHRTVATTIPAGQLPADVSPATYLPLPALDDLTIEQAAGRACVWGGQPIALVGSVDLGEQTTDSRHWFPRSCSPCFLSRLVRTYFEHDRGCNLCQGPCYRGCETARALRRFLKLANIGGE